ncbi:hypothetical protein G9A89_018903 [Geosiphon pyriformis]|nr:hypothetical protein G9A89_018903 [Geosiphon pyriformis]
MFSDEFTDSHHLSYLDGMWSIVYKANCFSVNEVFLKTWSKNFDVSDVVNAMFTKKLARDTITSSVNNSLRQKLKVSLGKVKHSGDEADLSFKVSASDPGQYKNMNTSSDEKLGHKIGKNLDYSANSKSDEPLNSCTNTPKAKCFNSGAVKASSLSFCNFGSIIDNVDMNLLPPVLLKSPLCSVASVKKRLCFELTKFFVLNIGLLAVPRSTLHNKLKGVRKLFYKINSFRDVSTLLKFPGIIRASFTSKSSFALAKQLAVSKNFVVNTNLKKINI